MNSTESGKLSPRFKLLYSTGDLSTSIPLAIVMFFQLYFLTDVAGLRPDQANYFVLVAQGSAILFIPLTVQVAQRLDKRRTFIMGTVTWSAVLLVLSALRSDQVALAYLLAALSGLGIATWRYPISRESRRALLDELAAREA